MVVLERVCLNLRIVCVGNSQEVENLMNQSREYWVKMRRQIHARIIRLIKEKNKRNDASRKYIESEINYLQQVKEGLR